MTMGAIVVVVTETGFEKMSSVNVVVVVVVAVVALAAVWGAAWVAVWAVWVAVWAVWVAVWAVWGDTRIQHRTPRLRPRAPSTPDDVDDAGALDEGRDRRLSTPYP